MDFKLKLEFIELDNLLKTLDFVASGAQAKQYILAGSVKVNGQIEIRVRRKLRAGDFVEFAEQQIQIVAQPEECFQDSWNSLDNSGIPAIINTWKQQVKVKRAATCALKQNEVILMKVNYSFKKHQKELAQKKKKEEKLQNKLARKNAQVSPDPAPLE